MNNIKKIFSESALDMVKSKLDPNLFDDKENLKPFAKNFILNKIEKWIKTNFPEKKLKSALLLGSSTSYQYNNTSDIDVNIELVPAVDKEKLKEIGLPNGELLPHTKKPINYYFQTTQTKHNVDKAEAIFDLLKNKWIKKPEKKNIQIPFSYAVEIAKIFMIGIDDKILDYETHLKELEYFKIALKEENEWDKDEIRARISIKEEEILADLDALYIAHHVVKAFRNEAFDENFNITYLIKIESKSPNLSVNNLVYKVIEKFGYFERLGKYEEIRKKKKELNEKA